ncbi:MAG: proprotein convertase P-domain-containing protein [Acidobacteria bacterium]|nr:proprotein convertase P-domain-containing protein [Acidobacteriota bacterium]
MVRTAGWLIMLGIMTSLVWALPPAPRTPALVEVDSPLDVARLSEHGFIIDDARAGFVRVYVNEEELQKLHRLGYPAYFVVDEAQAQAEALWAATKNTANPMAEYHTYDELTAELQAVAVAWPSLCRLYSTGQSVQGRELWMMKITDNPDLQEDEPEFHYISTMHGDEPIGTELLINLIHLLLDNYGVDPDLTALVNDVEMHFMPLMNPDGNVAHNRFNANGTDLNRDFPDRINDPVNTTTGREPETAAVMDYVWGGNPVLSANFHSGALVVNYPWDSTDEVPSGFYAACPDDDVFIHISETYSALNTPMWNNPAFPHGITNGNDWYEAYGGMQDWHYVWEGCQEVTIELSNTKWPAASQLDTLWANNRDSLVAYLAECLKGVRGIVTDAVDGSPVPAAIQVTGRDAFFYSDPDVGDYHRRLLDGTYSLEFTAENYVDQTVGGVVVSTAGSTRVDVALAPAPVILVQALDLVPIAGNGDPYLDPGETWAVALDLYNHGAITFHNTVATLGTTQPDIAILQPTQMYGDLAPKAVVPATAPLIRFQIDPDEPCGTSLDFTLTMTAEEDTFSDGFSTVIGAGQAAVVDSSDVPHAIPDNTLPGVTSDLPVAGYGPVCDLFLHVDITHPYIGDLRIYLISPQGTSVQIWNRQGGSAHNIHQDFPLPAFDGEEMHGTWQLRVEDLGPGDAGTLDNWSLTLPLYQCFVYQGLGDVNDDGLVDSQDCQLLAAYLGGNVEPSALVLANADLNTNGIVTIVDLVLLLLETT